MKMRRRPKIPIKGEKQSRPIDHEEIEELYMNYGDRCPKCNVLISEEFYVKETIPVP